MAKSKRKRRLEKKNQKEAKRIFTVVMVSTGLLLVVLYFVFANS
jgi:hypothetical protein